jgi:hypothetical protein
MTTSQPIACSLQGGEAQRRWTAWASVIEHRLQFDRSPQRLTVNFPDTDQLRNDLGNLVVAERECCGFVAWDLDDVDDQLLLTVSGSADGVTAISEAFRLEG